MNIQPTQNYSTQFKSAYPVINWVRETNGSYAPAVSAALNTKLQKSVIRLLNGHGKNVTPEKLNFMNYIKQIITNTDKDYAKNPVVRSFYNAKGGWANGKFEPLGYILSGQHAEHMTETMGKSIGRAKSESPGFANSAEVNIALGDYFRCGMNFVKKLVSNFKDENNTHYALHTKFEVIRSKTGKIKEYRLEDVRFCPSDGPNNPLVKTGYI
ncbi:MAG: hypothetical protein NC334_09440, partial [Bacteroides sp.]|nr:hypothetical protein [Bacteroides sp.]